MAKAKQKNRGELPPVQKLAFPETQWSRTMKAKLVEIDSAQAEHERIWGIGRVITLVPSEFRERFYAQCERVWAAQQKQDEEKFVAACDGMVRAFKAMDAWARSEGLAPVVSVKAVEGMTDLGMMTVVATEADAAQYLAIRPDVRQVWTIDELGKMIGAGIGSDLWRLKEQISFRATVAAVQQETQDEQRPVAKPVAGNGSGFDDMENDLDIDSEIDLPKMFRLPDQARKK